LTQGGKQQVLGGSLPQDFWAVLGEKIFTPPWNMAQKRAEVTFEEKGPTF